MTKEFFRNENGLSLVEVLLVTGMVAVLGMTFASIINDQQSSVRHLQQTLEANQIADAVRVFLNDHRNCDANFAGQTIPTATTPYLPATIVNNLGATVFTSGATSTLGGHVQLATIELAGPSYLVPIMNQTALPLNLHFSKRSDSAGGPLRPRQIDIMFVAAGATIANCAAMTLVTPRCRVERNSTVNLASVSVACAPGYKVFSCGWRDGNPTKTSTRRFTPYAPMGNSGGGCDCTDTDTEGGLTCYALCCML